MQAIRFTKFWSALSIEAMGDGAAQLQDAMSELRNSDFDGPISVHTEDTSDPGVVATVGGADESAAASR